MENNDPAWTGNNPTPSSPPATPGPLAAPAPAGLADERRKMVIVGAVGLGLLVACLVYIVVLHRRLSDLQAESTREIAAHLQTIYLQTQQVDALDKLAVRIDRFNREFGASVGKLQMTDSLEADIKGLEKKHLPDDAKKTLEEFEQSATAIQEMAAKMRELEHYLGAPVVVRHGDSHSEIARRYLVEEAKLPPAEADQVLRRTALAWELEPGNQVFNLYHQGILLSTVTQGSAKRAPLMVQWAQRQAVNARIQELEEKVRALEAKLGGAPADAPPPSPSP